MSVIPESVENLGEGGLQPAVPANEGERELVVVGNPHHPPPRRGSSIEREMGVTPNNDETAVESVFRILGDRILELAILDGPVGSSSPSRELALRYRLVCRGWRDTINSIYRTAALPLFEYTGPSFLSVDLVKVERMIRNLKSLTSLFAPPEESGVCSAVVPPVSLAFTLSPLPIPLETKIELEATAANTLRRMGRMLLTLKLQLPHNSLEGINCSSLDLENLKHAEFTFHYQNESTPVTLGRWKIVEEIVKAATSLQTLVIKNGLLIFSEMPELALPKSMRRLELHFIRIPMWLIDFASTSKNIRQLVLTIVPQKFSGQEPAGHMENLLVNKLSKYLELLELKEDLESWPLSRWEPAFSILEPMPKLRTLKLYFRCWKLGELRSYKELLPSLIHLKVWAAHFPASWYASPCSTLGRLRLFIPGGLSEALLFSQQVLGGISRSFPNLNELDVSSDTCRDDNWQTILCQGFPSLRKLTMSCSDVSTEGRNRLVTAVSGIPLEELQAIFQGEKELQQVVNNYQHFPSLRNLTNLQEFRLHAYGSEEDDDDQDDEEDQDDEGVMYCRVMVYSTFLRIPNLKTVVLSPMFRLSVELMQHARDVTGLDIYTD